MSGFWYEPEDPSFFTAAGGQASLGEIYQAARDASLYVDNTFAAQSALEQAYDDRNARIFDLTGEKLDNPFRWRGLGQDVAIEKSVSDWQGQVRELATRRPELAAQLMPSQTIEQDALSLSRDADQRFSELAGSRDGAGKWLAAFAGGGWGSVRDPVQLGTLMLGGGPGGARTVAGRILTTALSEAAVNAGVELALQPIVQSYRAKAGLEAGVGQAFENAAFAGLVGGVFGAGARGLGELLTRGGRSAERAAAVGAGDLPPELAEQIRANLPEATAAVRDSLPLPARGALDQVDMITHLDETRPAPASMEQHDITVNRAHQAAEALRSADADVPAFAPDQAQIARITDQLVGQAPAAPAKRQSLVEFIKARGGLVDDQGELAAIGAQDLAKLPKGRDRRVPLDRAREAAEEAGYIGRPGEVQTTTVADLLDAVDQELRGNPVFSRADAGETAARLDHDADRARVESRVAEVAAHAGPAVDDAIVREAAEISLRDGVDAFDALENVLVRQADEPGHTEFVDLDEGWKLGPEAYRGPNGERRAAIRYEGETIVADSHELALREVRKRFGEKALAKIDADPEAYLGYVVTRRADGRIGEPLPGWSDAELEAASAGRGPEPMPENGSPFDDPGRNAPELEISPDDVGLFGDIPIAAPDGRVISLEAFMADIANDAELAKTVKACRA